MCLIEIDVYLDHKYFIMVSVLVSEIQCKRAEICPVRRMSYPTGEKTPCECPLSQQQ